MATTQGHPTARTGATMSAPGHVVPTAAVPTALTPLLDRGPDGSPRLALTLLLERHPAADEPDIALLVVRGIYAMTIVLVRDPAASPAASAPPLFVRSGEVRLIVPGAGSASPLAAVDVVGTSLSAVLGGTLDADAALALLDALQGGSDAWVEYDLQVADEPVTRTVGLRGRWADVWDALRLRAGEHGRLAAGDVLGVARLCVTTGVVRTLVNGSADPVGVAVDAATELLASTARLVLLLAEDGGTGVSVRLRARPSSLMPLAVDEQYTLPGVRTVRGRRSLADLLEPVAGEAAVVFDPLVRLVALDAQATGSQVPVVPVSRRTRPARARRGRSHEMFAVADQSMGVELMMSGMADVGSTAAGSAFETLAWQPQLLNATLVSSVLTISPAEQPPEPGPIVTGGEDAVFTDRADPGRRWYVPEYRVRRPEPGVTPAESPYLFTITRAGLASGPTPTVGLDAAIRITLDPGMSDATRQALDVLGNPPAERVPVAELTASLEVPYRLEGSPDVAFHTLTGEVAAGADGSLVLTVRVLDHMARLCYGSLAFEGFQAQPAAVTVRFSFTGWQRSGGRARGGRGPLRVRSYGRLRARMSSGGLVGTRLRGGEVVEPALRTEAGTPWFELPLAKVEALQRWEPLDPVPGPTWVQVSVGHAARVSATLPCATYPDLYRQAGGDADQPIGCQDALRLGEAAPPAYSEIPSLASRSYRVLRSLEQPGRFVVLPAAFRITRLGRGAGERAFRPAVVVYAALGGGEGDRYVITASLGPAIAPHEWNALRVQLQALCPPGVEPQMQLPLDPTLRADAVDRWTVPDHIAVPVLTRTWDGFQVIVSTGLTDGLILNAALETTGITGEVTFTLGDASIRSTLVLDTHVVGPWPRGPLTTVVRGAKAHVKNRSERTADVTELVDATGFVVGRVDAPIAPGGTAKVAVTLAGSPEDADLVAVHTLRAERLTLDQISTYVSDVTTTVSVLNLVNFGNHGLARVAVDLRTSDGHVETRDVPEAGTADYPLTFPLTGYLSARTVELRARTTFMDGGLHTTAWFPWDLAASGNVVSITSQVLDLPPS